MFRTRLSNTVKRKIRHLTKKLLTTFSSQGNDDKSLTVDHDAFVICDERIVKKVQISYAYNMSNDIIFIKQL